MRAFSRTPGSVMPGIGQHPRYRQNQSMDPRILGFLGRAMSLEFSAGQHYMAQSSLAKQRQESQFADDFLALANEEFRHASMLTDRLVAHGALPSGSVLQPAMPAVDVVESLQTCAEHEAGLIDLYAQAQAWCANVGAQDDLALFTQLLQEEQAQLQRIQQWLAAYQPPMQQPMQAMNQNPRSFV
ncbi:ferritin [Thiomicrospira sp. WB1]|nr:ferritin [Thiomicrospira sp. WB1]